MAREVKRIGPFTQTTKALFSTAAERFVPGWDDKVSIEQAMDRGAMRARMGQKKSPLGVGKLKGPI